MFSHIEYYSKTCKEKIGNNKITALLKGAINNRQPTLGLTSIRFFSNVGFSRNKKFAARIAHVGYRILSPEFLTSLKAWPKRFDPRPSN